MATPFGFSAHHPIKVTAVPVKQALKDAIEKKQFIEMDRLECHHRERESQVVNISVSPLIDSHGLFSGAVMVVRDETRLAHLELAGVHLLNAYVPQGQDLDSPKFQFKLAWLARFRRYLEKRLDPAKDRVLWVGDLWERATFMRGMEDLLMDVVLNRDFVRGLLRGLADRILATMAILFDRFEFEGIAVSDDYGSQRSLMISPPDWRALVKPLLAEIYGLAKSRGKVVFHHTCGHVVPIIGDLIDIGLDILHPIQPEAMDILALKRDFGGRVTFCGGIPTQHLLVQGTPEQVRAEVRRLKREMGRGGGYILEPGITLQADVPLINMIAMIDEAMDATV